jgi:benzoylformate decarboxylase
VRVIHPEELAPALKRGVALEGVSLIEVIVDTAVPLLYAKN